MAKRWRELARAGYSIMTEVAKRWRKGGEKVARAGEALQAWEHATRAARVHATGPAVDESSCALLAV